MRLPKAPIPAARVAVAARAVVAVFAVVAASTAVVAAETAPALAPPPSTAPPTALRACPAPSGPTVVRLVPTRPDVAGSGEVALTMADSPYGVAVAADGRYRTRVVVRLEDLPPRPGVDYVVWAAPPSLDDFARLGSLASGAGEIEGIVGWNQFLVFVTAESGEGGGRWAGPILFTAMSPSGKLHPHAGHGIFESYSYLC